MNSPTKVDAARTAAIAAVAANTGTPPEMAAMQEQLATAMQIIADQADMLHKLQNPPPPTKPAMRAYCSNLPFITLQIMRGPGHCMPVQFIGGRLETDDPVIVAALEAMIVTQNSGFSHEPLPELPELQEMRADISNLAHIAHAKMIAAGEKTA